MREAKAKMSHFLAIIEYACFFALFYFFTVFNFFLSANQKGWKDTKKMLERG